MAGDGPHGPWQYRQRVEQVLLLDLPVWWSKAGLQSPMVRANTPARRGQSFCDGHVLAIGRLGMNSVNPLCKNLGVENLRRLILSSANRSVARSSLPTPLKRHD